MRWCSGTWSPGSPGWRPATPRSASRAAPRARLPEDRLRILVACGAAGGIAATFNAPVTGVFFGVEIILQELSVDALFTVMISAMVADVTARQFLGGGRFLTGFPTGITLPRATDYLLVAMLAVVAALAGLAFKTVLYKAEDVCDRVWGHRPEWARPAVGGVLLGVLLLAVPQLYGVGYPVMYQAVGGHYVLWFLLLLTAGKMVATSLTIGIGGSGGVFAHHRSSAPPPGWPSVNSRTIRWARPRATRRCTRRSRWARCSPPPYAPR